MTATAEVTLVRPSSLGELEHGPGSVYLAGGTEVLPQLRDGLLRAGTLVDVTAIVPRGVSGRTIGAGTTLAEIEARPGRARRRFARPAGSQPRRSSATWGRSAATCSSRRAAGTGGSAYPCRLHGGDRCHARDGEHREHAIFANDVCASAHPSDVAAALVALGATLRTSVRELPLEQLYRLPTLDDPATTALEPGELLLELEVPPADASVYLKAMDRKRWSFPLVGVAASRSGSETRIALAGVAPIPWLLDGPLDAATPLPGTEYKLELATDARSAGAR